MIYDLSTLRGYDVLSVDGKIGTLHDFYFSSNDWKIHYLLCDSGYQMTDRKVIFYTDAVIRIEIEDKEIFLNLEKEKILSSPFIRSENKIITKTNLTSLHEHYGWNKYWEEESYLEELKKRNKKIKNAETKETSEIELIDGLSCTREIINQIVTAGTNKIGLISNLLMEASSWELAYILVDQERKNSNLKIIIKPSWIYNFKNTEKNVHLDKEIDKVLKSPKVETSEDITEETDRQLIKI